MKQTIVPVSIRQLIDRTYMHAHVFAVYSQTRQHKAVLFYARHEGNHRRAYAVEHGLVLIG